MTSKVIITRPVWEEYRRIKPRLRHLAFCALIDYLMTGERAELSQNISGPFNRLLVAYGNGLGKRNHFSTHTSLTHHSHIAHTSALILHSSVTHRKKKKNEEEKGFPHTPYKKKKIKEEENPIFFLTSEYWGARDIFQRISAKAKGLLAKSWSSRTSRTGQTVGLVGLVRFLRLV